MPEKMQIDHESLNNMTWEDRCITLKILLTHSYEREFQKDQFIELQDKDIQEYQNEIEGLHQAIDQVRQNIKKLFEPITIW